MNNKQKLSYMVLGAVVLSVGIVIGQWVTPNIEAQHNGVFDQITCRKIVVVDGDGKPAVVLTGQKNENGVIILDKEGNQAIMLSVAETSNGVVVRDTEGNKVITLVAKENENAILVQGKVGQERIQIASHEEHGQHINIVDRAGNFRWLAP